METFEMKIDENILQQMIYFEVALNALDPQHLTIQMLRHPVVKLLIYFKMYKINKHLNM